MNNNIMRSALVLLLATTIFSGCSKREFHMPTASMEPTIPAGSVVVGDLRAYKNEDPQRFDIVLFHPPLPEDAERIFMFRIIGIPGEKVNIDDDAVRIDSAILKLPENLYYLPDGGRTPVTLGPDEFFVLGDNSAHALDSRYWGPVSRANIIGKVTSIQQIGDGNAVRPPGEERTP